MLQFRIRNIENATALFSFFYFSPHFLLHNQRNWFVLFHFALFCFFFCSVVNKMAVYIHCVRVMYYYYCCYCGVEPLIFECLKMWLTAMWLHLQCVLFCLRWLLFRVSGRKHTGRSFSLALVLLPQFYYYDYWHNTWCFVCRQVFTIDCNAFDVFAISWS